MNPVVPSPLVSWLERAAATISEVVFPPVCAGCGRLGTILCQTCIAGFAPVGQAGCHYCGRTVPKTEQETSRLCASCVAVRPLVSQVRAPFVYVEPISGIIHRLKYDGYFALAVPLGGLMAEHWPDWEQTPDLILPIPLHSRRRRKRGFNQSALLARNLAKGIGLEVDENALRRHRHTQSQINLGPEARQENVAGAFEADGDRVSGRNIVLIDDVYTTGATVSAAADALALAGAAAISAYCLARVS